MGLDMYALTTKTRPSTPTDFEGSEAWAELQYWRKHWWLHDWMFLLFRRKGGKGLDFSDAVLVLDTADLDELEEAIRAERKPFRVGIAYRGLSDRDRDLGFIAKARRAIAAGLTVIYTGDY